MVSKHHLAHSVDLLAQAAAIRIPKFVTLDYVTFRLILSLSENLPISV